MVFFVLLLRAPKFSIDWLIAHLLTLSKHNKNTKLWTNFDIESQLSSFKVDNFKALGFRNVKVNFFNPLARVFLLKW